MCKSSIFENKGIHMKHKNFLKLVFGILIFNLIFIQASAQTSLRELFNASSCAISCWLGIQPKVTTTSQLESILLQQGINYTVNEIDQFESQYSLEMSGLSYIDTRNGTYGVSLSVVNGIVVEINLPVNIPLQQIVQEYGAPSIANIDGNDTTLVYPSYGLYFVASSVFGSEYAWNVRIVGNGNLTAFFTGIPSNIQDCSVYSASGCILSTATPTVTRTPTITPTSSGYSCPCSIWGTPTPNVLAQPDSNAVEVGVKFQASVSGSITGLRFYKASTNTGTHTGHLFSSMGTLLGSLTFSGESASGWQTASFASPIAIQANTTYVAAYHAPNGHYSIDRPGLAADVVNGPLTALASAGSGGNGVYSYGSSGTFPTNNYQDTNYWVDVIFTTGGSSPTATNTPTRTPTATNTPTRTPTPTSGPSATPTRTPTAMATSASGSFPTTGVLDNFNRSNGAIGGNWDGHTWTYSISSNQLLVDATADNPIIWNPASFGADQQAYYKFGAINGTATEINLMLKMQGSDWTDGVVEILYNPAGNKVQVYTYTSAQDWVQRGADISVTFAVGDVFGARAKADGTVEVYKNGALVGSRSVTAWPYYASGGKISFGMYQAGGTIIDDFGGGNS